MTKRKQYLIIVVFLILMTIIFLAYINFSYAQRRTVQEQHWLPLIQFEPGEEPATPKKKLGLIYFDPNGDFVAKDYDGNKTYFAGQNISIDNFYEWAIDGNIIYVDGSNRSVGFFTNTPSASAYIQLSDKLVMCKTFTSAGINACIDALGSEGGEVYLPEGTYACTTQITIDYDNTTLKGAGSGTILKLGADISMIKAAINIDDIVFSDFVLDGNNINQSANNALLDIEGTERAIIENIHFKNFEEWALYIKTDNQDDEHSFINNCTFEDSSDTSSVAIYADSGLVNQGCIHITNCEFVDCDVGIHGDDPILIIKACKFEDCVDSAIKTTSAKSPNSIVSNCEIIGNANYAIYLINTQNWNISNNVIKNCDDYSICLDAGYGHIISNNTLMTPNDKTKQILLTSNCINSAISNNMFSLSANDSDYHIYLADVNTDISIYDNYFSTFVDTAAIYLTSSAADAIIYGNKNTTVSCGSGTCTYGDFTLYANFVYAGIDSDTIADSGDPNKATHTLTPTASYIELTCSDAHGCVLLMSETGAEQGQVVEIVNIGSNSIIVPDNNGVNETSTPTLGQWDTIRLIYSSDRWVCHGTQNNT